MDTSDVPMLCFVGAIVLIVGALIGGCQYTVHKEAMTKMRMQAEGKLPPDDVQVLRLEDNQLKLIINTIKETSNGVH